MPSEDPKQSQAQWETLGPGRRGCRWHNKPCKQGKRTPFVKYESYGQKKKILIKHHIIVEMVGA